MAEDTGVLFGTDDAVTVKKWRKKLFVDAAKEEFFSRFTGKEDTAICQQILELEGTHGDTITYTLRMRGFASGSMLESTTGITLAGSERYGQFYSNTVAIAEVGTSTKAKSKLDLQRPVFDLRTEMSAMLKEDIADWMENKKYVAATTAPTTDHYIDLTAESNPYFDHTTIELMVRKAMDVSPIIRPIKWDGKEWRVIIISKEQKKSLLADDTFMAGWQNAGPRDKSNPIFSGADFYWDGAVIYVYERAVVMSNNEARALLLGAQSLVIAYAQAWSWLEDLTDIPKRLPVVGTDALVGVGKTAFNSEDYGIIACDTKYIPD